MTHFHAHAGLSGCLPNYSAVHKTYSDATEDLTTLHELGRGWHDTLMRDGFLSLNLRRDGNEYCEIIECDCGEEE